MRKAIPMKGRPRRKYLVAMNKPAHPKSRTRK
jgi:hypothetical protein